MRLGVCQRDQANYRMPDKHKLIQTERPARSIDIRNKHGYVVPPTGLAAGSSREYPVVEVGATKFALPASRKCPRMVNPAADNQARRTGAFANVAEPRRTE
jgi:hypothetical protein